MFDLHCDQSGGMLKQIVLKKKYALFFMLLFYILGSPNIGFGENIWDPNIWYREFAESEKVFDIFFADKHIWEEEPIVIVINPESSRGYAIGFFTSKKKEIYLQQTKDKNERVVRYRYYFAETNKELKRSSSFNEPRVIGHSIEKSDLITFGQGEIIEELIPIEINNKIKMDFQDNKKTITTGEKNRRDRTSYVTRLSNGDITYVPMGDSLYDTNCEPVKTYLRKSAKNGQLIWAKSFVRLFPEKDLIRYQGDEVCTSGRMRLDSSIDDIVLLPDGTMLVNVPNYVIRVRQIDCQMPAHIQIRNFRIIDTRVVMLAKLEIMKEEAIYLKKRCSDAKYENRDDCFLSRQGEWGQDELQLDLARRLGLSK